MSVLREKNILGRERASVSGRGERIFSMFKEHWRGQSG